MGKKKGTTAFPVARIKKMMQADEDVGKIATLTPTLVGKALECLIDDVLTAAAAVTHDRRAKTIQPAHLREAIDAADKFDFLRGIVARVPLPDNNAGPSSRAPRTPKSAKLEPLPDNNAGPSSRAPRTPKSAKLEPGADPKSLVIATSKRPRSPTAPTKIIKPSPQLSKKPRRPVFVPAAQSPGQDCPPVLCTSEVTSVLPAPGVTTALPTLGAALNSGPAMKQSSLGNSGATDNENDDDEDYDDDDGDDEENIDDGGEPASGSGSAASSANKRGTVDTSLKRVTTSPNCGKREAVPVLHVSPMEATEEEDISERQRRYPKLDEPIDFAPAPRIFNPVPVAMKQKHSQSTYLQGPMLPPAAQVLARGEVATFTLPNIPLASQKPERKEDSSSECHDDHTTTERVSVMSLLS